MTDFKDLGLAEAILRGVTKAGYTATTPIQAAAIPVLLKHRDVIGIAQTGTGKTAAFTLPLLDGIQRVFGRPYPNQCDALVLAPTRELVDQIHQNIQLYGRFVEFTSTTIVGGVKAGKQVRTMSRGVNILVATPGRLEDLMASGAIDLSATKSVVLDEADQMLDMGFIPAIRRIMKSLPKKRQTVLFSATMPKQIRSLANDFLTAPKEISVAPASKPVDRIEQTVLSVIKEEKRQKLSEILSDKSIDRAIVFTRTKHGANRVARYLEQSGIRAEAIHGNKNQNQRQRSLEIFKSGEVSVLVATDVAARGIDIDGVSHVINFELPNVPEMYVHRIGRTARAGTSGIAISLCDASETKQLSDIEKLIGRSFKVKHASSDKGDAPEGIAKTTAPSKPRRNRRRPSSRSSAERDGNASQQGKRRKSGRPDGSKPMQGKPGSKQRSGKPRHRHNGQNETRNNTRQSA